MSRGQDRPQNMTVFKLSDLLHALCFFLFVVVPFCLAVDASDEQRHVRFLFNNNRDDNCGCQQGKCIHLSNGGFRCDCYDPGWAGEKCDTLVWTLSSTKQPYQQGTLEYCYSNCGHGRCAAHIDPIRHGEVYLCACEHGWHGEHCTIQETQPTHTDHCLNHCQHGVCVAQTDLHEMYHCQCDIGWQGVHCEQQHSEPTHVDHCHNHCQHGVCVAQTDLHHRIVGYHCQCDLGWQGVHCDQQHPEPMHMDHCNNHCQHGVCVGPSFVQGVENYHCQCDPGWHGLHCEQHLETMHMDHCNNRCQHGVCVGPSFVQGVESYHCQCNQGWHGGLCDQQSLSNSSTGNSTCDTSAIMTAVTTQTQVVNQNATECPTGSHSSHDALVLTHCHVPNNVSSWKQGVNVMSRCSGSTSLPTYTPVAAFDNGVYSSKGSLSGVFIACTANGFKMAFQLCGQPPQIADITSGGTNALNPAVYYTVV